MTPETALKKEGKGRNRAWERERTRVEGLRHGPWNGRKWSGEDRSGKGNKGKHRGWNGDSPPSGFVR